MKTIKEIENEIARVKTALANTKSEYLKRDYTKHLKRLHQEKHRLLRE